MDNRSQIQQQAEALTQYIEDGEAEVQRAGLSRKPLEIPRELSAEFERWITRRRPPLMWVQAPSFSPIGPALSQAALRAKESIVGTGTPCITFFCKSRFYSFAGRLGLLDKDAAVVSLLYSTIRQLAGLLPATLPSSPDLDPAQFAALNGTLHSLPTALNIIMALLVHTQPGISWIIDGLQHAGGTYSTPYLHQFIHILRRCKVCFTTDGQCAVLDRTVAFRERVDASSFVQGRGGRV
ncbi:hypothetical protein QBC40DRAFT_258833 [Triangularia verruculosa]|uniref:Uncharacterized protein n=1 Tax=Triangularia verruculosa TaxID=2587418 RepID=A0AAN6X7L0_9PEZI|nr:hypothetical protein QBC40DRAFT_258833 [Triangularia verruculosa]